MKIFEYKEACFQAKSLIKKCFYLTIIVVLLYGTVFAANYGTYTGEFLKINPEAGPAGMADAYTALAKGTSALAFNPAGLASMDKMEITATHLWWFQDINMEHVSFACPAGNGFGVGASVLWINYGSYDSTGGIMPAVNIQNGLINLGAGKELGDIMDIGLNVKGIYESFMGSSSLGLSADAGTLVYLGSRDFTLGLNIKNIGFLSGTHDLLPLEAGAGLGARLLDGTLNMDADINKIFNTDNIYIGAGVEYNIFKLIALRLGFRYDNAFEKQIFSFSDISKLVNISAGAGINLNDSIIFDYSFTPMGELSPTHRFTLKLKFGDSEHNNKDAAPDTNVKAEPKNTGSPQVSVQDGHIRSVSFKPDAPQENVKEWTLSIRTSDGKIVKTFNGTGGMPKTLNWDGTDESGKPMKADANFIFDYKAKNEAGVVMSETGSTDRIKKFHFIDDAGHRFIPLKGKEILVVPETQLVSSNTQERKQAPFIMSGKDVKKVKNWELIIYGKDDAVLKQFSGDKAMPSYIVWDGRDTYGNYAAGLKNCRYALNINCEDGKKYEIGDRQPMRDYFTVSSKSREIKLAKKVFFEENSAEIQPEMLQRLDELSDEIGRHTDVRVYIQGHSSREGMDDYNLKLSQDRAKNVLRYLVEKLKVTSASITAVGYGSAIPFDMSDSGEGRAKNRRVDIILIGKKQ
jgi:outer membrane protein OmpA-like peptidoglycan-associated protein